jgi:hypothetical protein
LLIIFCLVHKNQKIGQPKISPNKEFTKRLKQIPRFEPKFPKNGEISPNMATLLLVVIINLIESVSPIWES